MNPLQKILLWIAKVFHKKSFSSLPLKWTNLQRSIVDERDSLFAVKASQVLPSKVMLEGVFHVKNQGAIGSCGSHALCSFMEYFAGKDKLPYNDLELSERFHYYEVRQSPYMNTFPQDTGQTLREGLKVLQDVGVAPEILCPYSDVDYNVAPQNTAFVFAPFWKLKTYHRCYDLQHVKTALAAGSVVAVGMQVTADILTQTGIDVVGNGRVVGGHAVLFKGYDEEHPNPSGTKGAFYFLNSWGEWGDGGCSWISYDLVSEYLMEAWAGNL